MIQTIKCLYCRNSHIEFDKAYVNVNFKKHIKCCDKCNTTREESVDYWFFCSVSCFKNYIKEGEDIPYVY